MDADEMDEAVFLYVLGKEFPTSPFCSKNNNKKENGEEKNYKQRTRNIFFIRELDGLALLETGPAWLSSTTMQNVGDI